MQFCITTATVLPTISRRCVRSWPSRRRPRRWQTASAKGSVWVQRSKAPLLAICPMRRADRMLRNGRGCRLLLLVALVVAAGCARSPEAQKARHLERGDKHFAREQYREAVIEYRNVLRIEAANL